MFRTTKSPIFRSTFDFIYSFCTMHRYGCGPVAPVGSHIGGWFRVRCRIFLASRCKFGIVKRLIIILRISDGFCSMELLTPWSRVLFEKLTVPQLAKKFPTIYGTQNFITTFTTVRTSPYPEPEQFSPCPQSHFPKIHFDIIPPSTPGSSKWSLPLRFPHENTGFIYILPPYVLHAPPTSLFLI